MSRSVWHTRRVSLTRPTTGSRRKLSGRGGRDRPHLEWEHCNVEGTSGWPMTTSHHLLCLMITCHLLSGPDWMSGVWGLQCWAWASLQNYCAFPHFSDLSTVSAIARAGYHDTSQHPELITRKFGYKYSFGVPKQFYITCSQYYESGKCADGYLCINSSAFCHC